MKYLFLKVLPLLESFMSKHLELSRRFGLLSRFFWYKFECEDFMFLVKGFVKRRGGGCEWYQSNPYDFHIIANVF
jgi:hypothetical protein